MNAPSAAEDTLKETFEVELTNAAVDVVRRYGVQGLSVDQTLDLWNALRLVVRNPNGIRGTWEGGFQDREQREALIAAAADAAYRLTLAHGFQGSFLDLELDLWKALCQAITRAGWLRRSNPGGDGD